jgi:hypothetical protein
MPPRPAKALRQHQQMRQLPPRSDVHPAQVAVIPASDSAVISSAPLQLLLLWCTAGNCFASRLKPCSGANCHLATANAVIKSDRSLLAYAAVQDDAPEATAAYRMVSASSCSTACPNVCLPGSVVGRFTAAAAQRSHPSTPSCMAAARVACFYSL